MMSFKMLSVWMSVMVCCWMPLSSSADQNDPRLVVLFGKLQSSRDFRHVQHYTQEIWRIWSLHEDTEAREALKEGLAELYDEDYTASLWHINAAIARAPRFAEAWNSRAIFYFQQQDYEASLADIDRTLQLEPRHFGALVGQGQCYYRLHQYQRALDSFQRALAINPWLYDVQRNVEKLKALISEKARSI